MSLFERAISSQAKSKISWHLEGTGRSNHTPCPLLTFPHVPQASTKGCNFEWACLDLAFCQESYFFLENPPHPLAKRWPLMFPYTFSTLILARHALPCRPTKIQGGAASVVLGTQGYSMLEQPFYQLGIDLGLGLKRMIQYQNSINRGYIQISMIIIQWKFVIQE